MLSIARSSFAFLSLPSVVSPKSVICSEQQSLRLAAWQLPELLSVVAVDNPAGSGGAPGDLAAVPNPFADDTAVAVPVVPEVC